MNLARPSLNLNGKGFELKVKQGDKVSIGDSLVKFDRQTIHEAGYSTIIPMVITNTNKYHNIKVLVHGKINYNQELLELDWR